MYYVKGTQIDWSDSIRIQCTYGVWWRFNANKDRLLTKCITQHLLSNIWRHNWCSASKELKFTSCHFYIQSLLRIQKRT